MWMVLDNTKEADMRSGGNGCAGGCSVMEYLINTTPAYALRNTANTQDRMQTATSEATGGVADLGCRQWRT